MAKKNTVMIGGKPVDMDRVEEVAQVQATLLPSNWPIAKRDGVRLFLSLQEMSALEFKRHLAHNFSKIAKTALEQQSEGDAARVALTFSIEIDLTAPNVAAFAKTKMSFSHKYSTEGKPKTHDINQGDFLSGDGLSVVLNTQTLDEEMAPEPKPDKPKPDKEKKSGKSKKTGKGDDAGQES